MQKFAAFEKNFRHARMHTRSIIEFANVSYSYNFYRNDEYTRLVQTSAQTQDKNAAISGNAQLATSAEREVPRAEIASVSHHTARRKRRTVCPHKELQSAFIPFMTSERMSCKSLRTDKRKTLRGFSSPDFSDGDISADAFYGTSLKISAYFTGI